ncbi:large conductance mechanosensitive channel MscL [Cyanobacterium sp. HL-69]|uniref:large conductance mechanosensitive channel protein MscL n=1 Tax=Cyanobacterium sp. HL-69 TaxID=2054282 RepID=UPI000CA1ECFF|nr:large conductance mechanosensitive channel MscL [Cyanobacterium sp. HL-69]
MTTNNKKGALGKFVADFRTFIIRGNVIDLAVAVVIGAAFGRIVNSLVEDVITPLILNPAIQAAGVDRLEELSYGAVRYGLFISAVINFLVIAFCLFLLIRSFESLKRKLERKQQIAEAEAEAVAEEEINAEIVAQENLIKAIEKLTDTMNQKINNG